MPHSTTTADDSDDRAVIRPGREFEEAYRLDANATGEFLVHLGEQLKDGGDLTLKTEEWKLPFAFGQPIDLEVDYDGVGDPELEIEVTLPGRTDETAPSVE
jgi:amphi-Trp domain-containing protein